MRKLPRYPVYVISKGRHDVCLTARFLTRDRVPFHIVVEPQEVDLYAQEFPRNIILTLPFSNLGLGSIPARNWVWEHSKEAGYERHWILDDNIACVRRWYKGWRIRCDSAPAFAAVEDFTDRYENIAISGMNYAMFALNGYQPVFQRNTRVYSCLLIRNDLPYRWRGRYNEDTDLCLQVLGGGWCTVLTNIFLIEKMATLTMKGGNMETLYKGDGRLKMARALERQWPHIVSVRRRYGRPQHVVRYNWLRFRTQLKLKPGISLEEFQPDNYGLKLKALKEVQGAELRHLLEETESAPPPASPATDAEVPPAA